MIRFPVQEARFQRPWHIRIARPLLQVPARGLFIQSVACVLVENQAATGSQEGGDLGDRPSEIVNVMERATGHDRVEGLAGLELLERDGAEKITLGGIRVDGNDVVAWLARTRASLP